MDDTLNQMAKMSTRSTLKLTPNISLQCTQVLALRLRQDAILMISRSSACGLVIQ